jgi:low affinity Fe/Cu permease
MSAESPEPETFRDRFNRLADKATAALGSAWALLASILLVVVWAVVGPLFAWSDSWQLFINTTTTVITFWMVFVIQNSQNRDARALHLKLDEIIRATEHARNEFIVAEKASEAEIAAREEELHEIVEGSVDEALDERVPQEVGETVRETVDARLSHAIDRHTEARHGDHEPAAARGGGREVDGDGGGRIEGRSSG